MKFQASSVEFKSYQQIETVFFGNEAQELALTLSNVPGTVEHYVEWNDQSNACYNGVKSIQFSRNALELELLPEAAEKLGESSFSIEFDCEEADYKGALHCLQLIFRNKLVVKKTAAKQTAAPAKDYSQIRYLNLEGKKLKKLPEYVRGMAALETARLAHNPDLDLQDAFEVLANCPNLHDLSFTAKGDIPENFGKLTNVQTLSITGLTQPCRFPESIGQLKKLKSLLVMSDSDLALPETFAELPALEDLNLRIDGSWNLPEKFFQLSKLTQLDFTHCRITHFSPAFAQMTSVKTVIFCSPEAPDFSRILPIVVQMPNLKTLEINMHPIPPEVGLFKNIEKLTIWAGAGPENPLQLPDVLFELTQLQTLLLSRNVIAEIPEGIGRLKQLHTLNLQECDFETLPDAMGELSSLEILSLSENPSLKSLPETLGNLTQLKHLNLEDLPQLKEIPKSLENLKQLETVRITNPEALKNIPESWSKLLKSF